MQHYTPDVFVPARPTRPAQPRHTRLFELIRQENLADALATHIDSHHGDNAPTDEAAEFLSAALNSLDDHDQTHQAAA